MEKALIAMAVQIAKLQKDNDNLRTQLLKNSRKKKVKVDPQQERFHRVERWVAHQYQKGFNNALNKKENKERLTQIRNSKPTFMPLNNCMDFWPSSNNNK